MKFSVSMQFIDLSKYDGRVLPALRDHFKKIVIPQIRQYDQWGPLKENKQGQHQIEAFRRTLSDFESYLNSAQTNIDGAVKERIKITKNMSFSWKKVWSQITNLIQTWR